MIHEITDTAKELIAFKSHTQTIPLAQSVAKYLGIHVEESIVNSFSFWTSVIHFEMRYRSLNYFVEKCLTKNILELSSGFSFRGLDLVMQNPEMTYWDTDLEGILSKKRHMLTGWGIKLPDNYKLQNLDVMDLEQFPNLKDDALIINEGLLMYFDRGDQQGILKNIRRRMADCNGLWATSDIYVKHEANMMGGDKDKRWSTFFNQNNVNDHYFDSFEYAEEFFFKNGFTIVERYIPEFEKLSSLPELLRRSTPEQLELLRSKGKIQETWLLKAI